MKTNRLLSLAAMLCISLLFSCTTTIEPPPPLPEPSSSSVEQNSILPSSSSSAVPVSSSSANESIKYCVYSGTQQCFLTSQTVCPAGGELSDFCPFPTPSSSSLAEVTDNSSSSQIEQSSSDAAPEYDYCVFDADKTCLSGTPTSCPLGGTLSNECPYSSSSIALSSSSSNAPPSSYKMTALIYDTDNSVNPSFSGNYRNLDTANDGIRRGIVAPTLDAATRKPIFVASPGRANWVNAESFNAAFIPKGIYDGKVSNIPRCYDMPLDRIANGTWEFDSDKMRTPTGDYLVGGFYPYILDSLYSRDQNGTEADYTDCPACRKEYTANCFNTLTTDVPQVTYKGITYRGIEAFDRTYFPDGTSHHTYYNHSRYGCETPNNSQVRPGFDGAKKTTANLSFCFESHAEFIYEKEQEFFFRGDDDIWVFINNQLVIDLGGIHLPAPGYVDLDTITIPEVLVEGRKYPLDIFFCERMGTQSNIRISTNIYLTQTTGTCEF